MAFVKPKGAKLVPLFIAIGVIAIFSLLELLPRVSSNAEFFQRLEWITYDWRMRGATSDTQPIAPNLGIVFIDDDNIRYFNTNETYGFSFPWPRQLYAWLVEELNHAGAKAVAFDIIFSEQHPKNPRTSVQIQGDRTYSADEYFALQMRDFGGAILSCAGETADGRWKAVPPCDLFRTNALIGHIASTLDSDGVLRRAYSYRDDPKMGRLWHIGIVMAARSLNLDLTRARVEPGRIVIPGENRLEKIIPIDRDGTFMIDWSLSWNDKRLVQETFESVIERTSPVDWKDKLVVVGSIGSGNNISDLGATPVSKETYLVSKHWNIVNTILMDRFITKSNLSTALLLIVLLGLLGAVLTLEERVLTSAAVVLAVVALYTGVAWYLFVDCRYWLPIVLPMGALVSSHVCLVTHRLVFEQSERRRVRAVFSRIVSPEVVNELLSAEKLALGGARREITIFFADIRGFTEMTDSVQAKAEEFVKKNQLSKEAADAYFNEIARETLETVNLYLATIADVIKKYSGTLDKYIGDCVMAFWGAPTANKQHALCAVRAAIEAQRGIYQLNQTRFARNELRKKENEALVAAGKEPQELLPLLTLGTGINSGTAIVGLMGSDAHILNYTVFGREVNLASRLESVSGRGRIIIGESTFLDLQRDDPQLAATCVLQPAVTVKGIRGNLNVYEVPWKVAAPAKTTPPPPPPAASSVSEPVSA